MTDQGLLSSKTQMPPFNVLGLLLGGQGYASGWFQQRDRLAMADAALAKERADRASFAQTMLADPRWKSYLTNPNDRAAQGNMWGLMMSGPESAANLGNTLLTQGIGAIQSRELAGMQDTYQRQQQQQAHEFRLNEQTHGTDEALRLDQLQMQQKLQVQQQAADYIAKAGQDGQTPEMNQMQIDKFGDFVFPGDRKQGYSWAVANGKLIGQMPQRGTPERTKIEETGNAYSNVVSMAQKHLWQLEQNQLGSITEWNTENIAAMGDLRKIYEAGAMNQGDFEHYEKLLPSLNYSALSDVTADVRGVRKEQLRALNERFSRDLNQYVASTLVPLSTYTGDDWRAPANFRPGKIPDQSEFNKPRDVREQRLQDLNTKVRNRQAVPVYDPYGRGPVDWSQAYRPEQGPPMPPELMRRILQP